MRSNFDIFWLLRTFFEGWCWRTARVLKEISLDEKATWTTQHENFPLQTEKHPKNTSIHLFFRELSSSWIRYDKITRSTLKFCMFLICCWKKSGSTSSPSFPEKPWFFEKRAPRRAGQAQLLRALYMTFIPIPSRSFGGSRPQKNRPQNTVLPNDGFFFGGVLVMQVKFHFWVI